MADHVISIEDSINMFGLAPSTKWNAFNWGEANWGEGTNGLFKEVVKVLDTETQGSSDSLIVDFVKVLQDIQETGFVQMAMTDTKLNDSSGYSYVFPGGTTDAEDQTRTTWSEVSTANPTWTSGVVRGTSWS